MNNEVEKKAIDIAKELCSLSDEELLNLPEVDDYDFIDDIFDQFIDSQKSFSDDLLNAEVYTNNIDKTESFAYKTIDVEKTDCKDSKDFVYEESDLIWAA
ncbi:MAG: hypothetical protein J5934_06355 [Succinivibrio sp.]|nr:hypothetical protein [Succinivibrio sp.]